MSSMNAKVPRGTTSITVIVLLVWLTCSSAAPATPLPDGRAYEQVTGGPKTELFRAGTGWTAHSTRDGNHVLFGSVGSFGDPEELVASHYFLSARGVGGWTPDSVIPGGGEPVQATGNAAVLLRDFTDSLQLVVNSTHNWDGGDQDVLAPNRNGNDVYLLAPGAGPAWVSNGPLNANGLTGLINYHLGTEDSQHLVFNSATPLLPADEGRTGTEGLYEWHAGVLRLVGVDDSGQRLSDSRVWIGSGPGGSLLNALSAEGSRIFFSPTDNILGAGGPLLVREDGATTTPIPPSAPGADATFAGATPDGSKVFFTATTALTADDTDAGSDLFEYDFESGSLTRISAGPSGAGQDADVQGPVLPSDDGSRIYFTANGQLVPGEGVAGTRNLYLYDGQETRFVATIGQDLYEGTTVCSSARVTPDGGRLLFGTSLPALPEDTDTQRDLYLYDFATDTLRRVSRGAAGGNGAFHADLGAALGTGFGATCSGPAGAAGSRRPSHALSDDGGYVFFETAEALVPADTNGLIDVYEYDAASDQTHLISTGTSVEESRYLDASASGRDVFFVTSDQLVFEDGDFGPDIYDARIGGGFPRVPRTPCAGAECRGAGTPQPGADNLGSYSFGGPGNVMPGPRGSFAVRFARAQRTRLARTGRGALRVRVNVPGRLSAFARARLSERRRRVGSVSRRVGSPGTVRLTLRLSREARRALARRGALRLSISVHFSRVREPVRITLTLREANEDAR
jgi:hypothetical protein